MLSVLAVGERNGNAISAGAAVRAAVKRPHLPSGNPANLPPSLTRVDCASVFRCQQEGRLAGTVLQVGPLPSQGEDVLGSLESGWAPQLPH